VKRSFVKSVRLRIIVLVLLCLIPALGIVIYTGVRYQRQQLVDIHNNTLITLRSLEIDQEHTVESTRQLLITLAKLPEIRGQKPAETSLILRELLKLNPLYVNIMAVNTQGKEYASALALNPTGAEDKKYFRDAAATKDFSVGEYVFGVTANRPVLHFAYPVHDRAGRFNGVVAGALDLDRYSEIFSMVSLPPNSVLVLADYKGTILYRYPGTYEAAGRPDAPEMLAKMSDNPLEGVFTAEQDDGVKRLYAYKRFYAGATSVPYLFMRVGVPEMQALSQVRSTVVLGIVLIALAFSIAVAFAWFIGDIFVTKDIRKLVTSSRTLGRGDLKARTGIPARNDELGELAQAFDDMAEKLELRDLERTLAGEALRESENRFRSFFELSGAGFAITSPHGAWIRFNRKLADMLGYSSEELLTKTWKELTPPEDLPSELRRYEQALAGKKTSEDIEKRYIRKDGALIYVHISSRPVRSPDGTIEYFLSTITDITWQKEAEQALSESVEKYRNIFENAVEGIFQSTPDGRFLGVNPAMAEMCGFSTPEEMVETITDIESALYVHPGQREAWKRLMEERGVVKKFEHPIYRKDGSVLWISTNSRAVRDDSGEILYYEGTHEDITERKQAEERLKESENRYRLILNSVNDAVFTHDEEGNIIDVNNKMLEMYRVAPEQAKSFSIRTDYSAPDNPTDKLAELWAEVLDGKEQSFEWKARRPNDGTTFDAEVFLARIELNSKNLILASVRDITERKAGEQERTSLENQLRQSQKMEAVGTLAGGIAHDFNNILTVLAGYGSLLQMKMEKDDPLRMYVDQVMASSQKASQLTSGLLAFSRKQSMELAPCRLNSAIGNTEKLLKRLLTEDIDLKINLPSSKISVMADTTQIDQVLFNLVANARDAMAQGGTLSIELTETVIDSDFVRHHGFGTPGNYALISVSDTGTGMDEDTRIKAFEPFFTTKEHGKGTGLGLSIVYGIVKQHDGYINVDSEPGKGTTFSIYLPIKGVSKEEDGAPAMEPGGGTETILVAEDDDAVRQLLLTVLSQSGYTIIEAMDGEDAVEKFQEHKATIDLLITDVVMPKKNGKKAYEEIREIKPDIKVVFISGYTRDVIFTRGIESDASDFIQKPLSPAILLIKVREILDRQVPSV